MEESETGLLGLKSPRRDRPIVELLKANVPCVRKQIIKTRRVARLSKLKKIIGQRSSGEFLIKVVFSFVQVGHTECAVCRGRPSDSTTCMCVCVGGRVMEVISLLFELGEPEHGAWNL